MGCDAPPFFVEIITLSQRDKNHSAQGCEERATLGQPYRNSSTLKGVASTTPSRPPRSPQKPGPQQNRHLDGSAFCILHSAFCILHSAFCIREVCLACFF